MIQSFERSEDWAFCFPDDSFLEHVPVEVARAVDTSA